ncbi:MAG: gfo/Idh/MocA family oxidoreductase [Acidobacteria bacterium]|nr:MAG: gfo/Idh/MocA family oxidoreductase [Acidobacteriota bacterium]
MSSRRTFFGQVLGGTASLALRGWRPTTKGPGSSSRVLGASDRVRVGLIGAGGRGQEILKEAMRCPNAEAVAVADVYTRRHDEVKRFAPGIKAYTDFRRLLDDRSVDAVLIATPQHLHALHFVPAIQAGKDVYQEKTMAFGPDHAKRMRRAFNGSGRVVQIGIQSTSSAAVAKAREHATQERMGPITAIHSHMYRNAPYGGWMRRIPADCDPQHVDWNAFQGEAKPHLFDPDRLINWRFYWDYSGGNVFENMVHQVGFWYKVLDLAIPRGVTMSGGNYLSPKMQVPDTMNVAMDQPENLLFTWNSGFYNNHYPEGDEFVLGVKGTVIRDDEDVRYVPEGGARAREAAAESAKPSGGGPDIVGSSQETGHMQNFIDCVRSRKQPNCPFEIGFRSAIACQMAIASLRQGRTVRWDTKREEIV